MKATILKAVILFAIFGFVLNPGAVLATDTWVGGTSGSETSWSEAQNWLDGSVPTGGDVILDGTDPPNEFLCELDVSFPPFLNTVTITGDSPTKMTFNIKDKTLTVLGDCVLNDYAELDIDQDFTTHNDAVDFAGALFVDVATDTAAFFDSKVDILGSGSISCTLELDTNITGSFTIWRLYIDADNSGGVSRGLKLRASGSTMTLTSLLQLVSEQGSTGTNKAKLWNAGGRLFIESGDADNPAVLDIDGGNAPDREAQLDLDDTLAADETQATGNIRIDVGGPTAYLGEYTINGPSLIRLTGAGKAVSGPRP